MFMKKSPYSDFMRKGVWLRLYNINKPILRVTQNLDCVSQTQTHFFMTTLFLRWSYILCSSNRISAAFHEFWGKRYIKKTNTINLNRRFRLSTLILLIHFFSNLLEITFVISDYDLLNIVEHLEQPKKNLKWETNVTLVSVKRFANLLLLIRTLEWFRYVENVLHWDSYKSTATVFRTLT